MITIIYCIIIYDIVTTGEIKNERLILATFLCHEATIDTR